MSIYGGNMKRYLTLMLTTLFYGFAFVVDAPYRIVNGDYYVVILVETRCVA